MENNSTNKTMIVNDKQFVSEAVLYRKRYSIDDPFTLLGYYGFRRSHDRRNERSLFEKKE